MLVQKEAVWRAGPGVTFHGEVEPLDGGLFRATCHARRLGQLQESEFRVCGTEQLAWEWIKQIGLARGFNAVEPF